MVSKKPKARAKKAASNEGDESMPMPKISKKQPNTKTFTGTD